MSLLSRTSLVAKQVERARARRHDAQRRGGSVVVVRLEVEALPQERGDGRDGRAGGRRRRRRGLGRRLSAGGGGGGGGRRRRRRLAAGGSVGDGVGSSSAAAGGAAGVRARFRRVAPARGGCGCLGALPARAAAAASTRESEPPAAARTVPCSKSHGVRRRWRGGRWVRRGGASSAAAAASKARRRRRRRRPRRPLASCGVGGIARRASAKKTDKEAPLCCGSANSAC